MHGSEPIMKDPVTADGRYSARGVVDICVVDEVLKHVNM